MHSVVTGRRPASRGVTRTAIAVLSLMALTAISACTTVEGTNALTDVGTFEREVMTSTLQGLGAVPREEKDEDIDGRGPLVLPRDTSQLPAPQQAALGNLPEDSDMVQIDTSNLTEEDLRMLRNARVVDLRSLSGRPLTEAEARALTERMRAARMEMNAPTARPLYLPPDEYFTTAQGGVELICLAANGDLVPLTDPACPPEIRAALAQN